jgi:hypothetical protein
LRNVVVKSGDSAGARDVHVLHRSTARQRQDVYKNMEGSPSRWTLQRYVVPSKEVFPVPLPDGVIGLVPSYMLYSAYYSRGQYVGAHALVSPYSPKIHGGTQTYHVPVAVY